MVKFHLPMPYRFGEPRQVSWGRWEVPGILRTGGVDVRLPGAIRYRDGITS